MLLELVGIFPNGCLRFCHLDLLNKGFQGPYVILIISFHSTGDKLFMMFRY